MLAHLAKLPRLIELRVFMSYLYDYYYANPNSLPSLKSVEVLQMEILSYCTIPTENFYRTLPVIFPNLRQVTVVSSNAETRDRFRFWFSPTRFPKLTSTNFYTDIEQTYHRPAFFGRHLQYESYQKFVKFSRD